MHKAFAASLLALLLSFDGAAAAVVHSGATLAGTTITNEASVLIDGGTTISYLYFDVVPAGAVITLRDTTIAGTFQFNQAVDDITVVLDNVVIGFGSSPNVCFRFLGAVSNSKVTVTGGALNGPDTAFRI